MVLANILYVKNVIPQATGHRLPGWSLHHILGQPKDAKAYLTQPTKPFRCLRMCKEDVAFFQWFFQWWEDKIWRHRKTKEIRMKEQRFKDGAYCCNCAYVLRFNLKKNAIHGPYSPGGHIGHRQQISYPEPRVEMFGNEFRWRKTRVFNPSGLNMAPVWSLLLCILKWPCD